MITPFLTQHGKLKLCSILMLALLCTQTKAQNVKVAYSESFEEYNHGLTRIIQTKGGSTILLNITKGEGITEKIYDKSHKLVVEKQINDDGKDLDFKNMPGAYSEGIYEINGEVVLFIKNFEKYVPQLYRVRLNESTGAVVKSEIIATLPKMTMSQGYALAFSKTETPDFFVRKDPASDAYAVVTYNTFAEKTDDRIKIAHFDGNHKKISDAFFKSPGGKYKYSNFIDMCVRGTDQVLVLANLFNTIAKTKGGGERTNKCVYALSVKPTGAEEPKIVIESNDKLYGADGTVQYDPSSDKFIALLELDVSDIALFKDKEISFYELLDDDKDFFVDYLTNIDPKTLQTSNARPLSLTHTQRMNDRYALFESKKLGGIPQTFTVLNGTKYLFTEAMVHKETRSMSSGGSTVKYETQLKSLAISQLNSDNTETGACVVPKNQFIPAFVSEFYIQDKKLGLGEIQPFFSGLMGSTDPYQLNFLSYDFINTGDAVYVLINETPTNVELPMDKPRSRVSHASGTTTLCFKAGADGADRSFVYGKGDRENTTFSNFATSSYSKESKTYATMCIKVDGRKKEAYVAWLSF